MLDEIDTSKAGFKLKIRKGVWYDIWVNDIDTLAVFTH